MQGQIWYIFDAENETQSAPMSTVHVLACILDIKPNKYKKIFLWTPGWVDWMSLKEFVATQQETLNQASPPKTAKKDTVTASTSDKSKTEFPTQKIERSSVDELPVKTTTETLSVGDSPYTEVLIGNENSSIDKFGYYAQDFNAADLSLDKIKKMQVDSSTKRKITRKKAPAPSLSDRRKETRHPFKIEVVLIGPSGSFRTYSLDISLSGTLVEEPVPEEFLNRTFDLIIVNPFEKNQSKARLLFHAKIVGDPSDPRRLEFAGLHKDLTDKLSELLDVYRTNLKQLAPKTG